MTDPVTPSPAATLVLLRDRAPAGVEALLIQRHAKSKFAAGDHVFAGGKVEPEDSAADVERLCGGLTAEEAAARLAHSEGVAPLRNLPPGQDCAREAGARTASLPSYEGFSDALPGDGPALRNAVGYWVGAIREAFEEVGILLAYTPDGELVRFTRDNRERFAAHREACQASNQAFFSMLRAEELTLATDRLTYFAHWVTPEENPIRFDTRFFAAVAPPGQEPTADGREIVALRWLSPAEALEALRRQEISLRFPTIKNLEIIGAAGAGASAAEVVASLAGRPVPTIRPRILVVEGRPVAILPGDPRWY